MPLAIVQKISVGGSEFSASYLFMAAVIVWTILRGVLRVPKYIHRTANATFLAPLVIVALMAIYGLFNGFDWRFVMAVLLWTIFTFLGMLLPDTYLIPYSRLMVWLSIVTAVLGIALYIINIPLIDLEAAGSDQYFVDAWGHYRASSVFLNPNSFGYFLLFYLSIKLFGVEKPKRIFGLGFLCVVIALLLSGSRSSWAACLVLIVLRIGMAIAPRIRLSIFLFVNAALLTLMLILVVLSDLFVAQDIRFEKWDFSIEIFLNDAERVLLGVPESIPLEKFGMYFSDNMFLTFLFKFGSVGFIVFLVYYLFILYRAVIILVKGDRALYPFAAYLIAASVMLFYSNFLLFYPMVLLHGVAVGVLLSRVPGSVSRFSTSFKAA